MAGGLARIGGDGKRKKKCWERGFWGAERKRLRDRRLREAGGILRGKSEAFSHPLRCLLESGKGGGSEDGRRNPRRTMTLSESETSDPPLHSRSQDRRGDWLTHW